MVYLMQWDHFEEYKNRNTMWFNMYKPNETQYKILTDLVFSGEDYNNCGLLEDQEGDYRYIDENLFILTHPIVEEIITRNDVSISVHIPLGYIQFEPLNDFTFNNEKGETFKFLYVRSRCSFGLWPQFKNYVKAVSEIEHSRINIGEILNLFLEGFAKKYAIEHKVDKVVLFNLSLHTAMSSHYKNGWNFNFDSFLKKIKTSKGKPSKDLLENLGYYENAANHMYKIIT
jgi:hypothetical protein